MSKELIPQTKKVEPRMLSSHSLLILRWKDKKYLYMNSIEHFNINLVDTRKRKKCDGQFDIIINPSCVIEYNTGMEDMERLH